MLAKYNTLPKICGRPKCMMHRVMYIGPDTGHFKTGKKYATLWKMNTDHKGNFLGFEVDIHIIVRYNRNGKPDGYIQVLQYQTPEKILDHWDFTDLKEWRNQYE